MLFDFIYFDFVSVNILHKYTLCKYSSLFYVLPSKLCNSISIQMAISFKINIIYPSEPCNPISIQMVIIYTQGDIVRCLLALVRTVQVPISIRHCWLGADSPDVCCYYTKYAIISIFAKKKSSVHYEQMKKLYAFLHTALFFKYKKNYYSVLIIMATSSSVICNLSAITSAGIPNVYIVFIAFTIVLRSSSRASRIKYS